MSTPLVFPTTVQLTTQAVQVQAAQPNNTVTFINNDTVNNIFLSTSSSVYPFASNAIQLAAQGSISLSTTQTWYACSDVTAQLIIAGGGTQWSASPTAIAETLIASGFAGAIAAAIATAGIGQVANPILLYDVPEQIPGAQRTGATQGITSYPPNTTMGQAITQWNDIPGIPLTTVAKVYYTPGEIPATFAADQDHDLPFFVANGIKCLMCLKPDANGDQVAELTTFMNLCSANSLIADVVLWQEVNDNQLTPAQFIAMWNTYAPIVRAAGYPCCMDFAINLTNGSDATIGPYFTNAISATVDKVYADFYNKDWDQFQNSLTPPGPKGRNLLYVSSLADTPPNGQSPISFGIGEFNSNLTGSEAQTPAQSAEFFAYIQEFMLARLSASKLNADTLLFNGSGPLGDPLIIDDTDPRISTNNPSFQDVYEALSALLLTVPAGATITLAAVNPSPLAGYAPANGLSYDITVAITAALSGSTIPFAEIELDWFNSDSLTAEPINPVVWSVPIGIAGSSGALITGKGPQRGKYLNVKFTNNDTVACYVAIQVNSTSRNVSSDKWYWGGSVGPPGYTLPGGAPYGNSLGSIGSSAPVTIVPGGSTSRLLNMYSGAVWCFFEQGGATGSQVEMILTPQPSSVWGDAPILDTFVGGPSGQVVYFPRAPILATFKNNQSSGDVTVQAEFIALD